jgi:hypothetical protein
MAAKSQVYSWRLSPRLKADLEDAARVDGKSLAELLDQIAQEWLARSEPQGADDRQIQQRLRERAMKVVGSFDGKNPDRAAHAAREVRRRIARRNA